MGWLSSKLGASKKPTGSIGIPTQFAIVDCETTGLFPQRDRIIEIAVVVMKSDGTITSEFVSLINPHTGDAGRTDIHGIESEWLDFAPSFEEVTGHLAKAIAGRVFVAHNADFDFGFVDKEFKRAGLELQGDIPTLCTMRLARQLGVPASLKNASKYMNLGETSWHSALNDARATARLLASWLPFIEPATLTNSVAVRFSAFPVGVKHGSSITRVEAAEQAQLNAINSQENQ
jgi:DNA polymerase III epsilon subunit family exonuclease